MYALTSFILHVCSNLLNTPYMLDSPSYSCFSTSLIVLYAFFRLGFSNSYSITPAAQYLLSRHSNELFCLISTMANPGPKFQPYHVTLASLPLYQKVSYAINQVHFAGIPTSRAHAYANVMLVIIYPP